MSSRFSTFFRQVVILFLLAVSSIGPAAQVSAQPAAPNIFDIAYVFRANDADALAFKTFLDGIVPKPGYAIQVTLVPLGAVLSTDFSKYAVVMIADDTGLLDSWGSPLDWPTQVIKITAPNVPILGIGEGGYSFFGKLGLFIGWPMGWHGPLDRIQRNGASWDGSIYNGVGDPIIHYLLPVNSVGIFIKNAPVDVNIVGLEDSTPDHANLIFQGCRFLWGSGGSPNLMTKQGKVLFTNYVIYLSNFQCPPRTPPSPTCVTVKKSALTEFGLATVVPGEVIAYTLEYTLINNGPQGACVGYQSGKLIDAIPADTNFVAGSASDGITPDAAGQLIWTVSAPAVSLTKTFKVQVAESQCTNQKTVINQARMEISGFLPALSNQVLHTVNCNPGITLPNTGPFYAEDELEVHPYPLAVGVPTTITARLLNPSAVSQPVTVQFQIAPELGIGLVYTTVATRAAVLPAGGAAVVTASFTPTFSGQTSFQVVVSGPGLSAPLVTQSNLDMSEDFVAGTPDTLNFKVRNNTPNTTNILLVIDNTCPGWSAVISNPASGVFTSVAPGAIVNAAMTVTPPASTILGSGCTIDVQAWDGTTSRLISGIRKLDVPPVHLPPRVTPPWEEPEIVLIPEPPVAGSAGQICVELSNPTGVDKPVKIEYSVADFGAGIPFAPVATKDFILPPHSFGRYCTDWTPDGSGTLHKCILVTLSQTGFRDMHSQRNVDITRTTATSLDTFSMPFSIGSPDGQAHKLAFVITAVGIDPFWTPRILPDPPPPVDPAGIQTFTLSFAPSAGTNSLAANAPGNFQYGSASQVEVKVLMDGVEVSGFTVQIQSLKVYLPVQSR